MKKIVLAIVGLPGSGKTEATKYLMKKTEWPKVYFGDVTFEEMAKRGLLVSEKNERMVREDIRAKLGLGAYAILSLPKIKAHTQNSCVILESLYGWEEYLVIKEHFGDSFYVLAIYSSPAVRSKRLVNRVKRPLTSEEFQKRDYAQIENLHQAGPIARADYTIINEGSLEDLHSELDKIFEKISKLG